jgi:hypothetical protein
MKTMVMVDIHILLLLFGLTFATPVASTESPQTESWGTQPTAPSCPAGTFSFIAKFDDLTANRPADRTEKQTDDRREYRGEYEVLRSCLLGKYFCE